MGPTTARSLREMIVVRFGEIVNDRELMDCLARALVCRTLPAAYMQPHDKTYHGSLDSHYGEGVGGFPMQGDGPSPLLDRPSPLFCP
jgi:hypothetical protein